nr:hypothetical protein [Tanacetum cinerariifolium]
MAGYQYRLRKVIHFVDCHGRQQVFTAQIQPDQHHVSDVDRRVGTRQNTDKQRDREAMQAVATEDPQCDDCQQCGDRSRHGPQQRLRRRDVDVLDQRCLAQQTEVFTHPVEHNDGVVERVPDDCQHCGQHGQVERHLEERQDPHRHHNVVDQRHNRPHRKLPLEPEGQVNENPAQRQQHAQAALITQLFTNLRADEFNTFDGYRVVGTGLAQCFGHLRAQLRVFTRHADKQVSGRTEALHDRFGITGSHQFFTNLVQVGRTLVGQLDQRTAGEVQTEVQPFIEPAEQRHDGEEHGNGERNVANAHEVDSTFHGSPLNPQLLEVTTAKDQVDHCAGHHDGCEHRGKDPEGHGDRKTLHRACAHRKENAADQQRRQVGVEDGSVGAVETFVDRTLHCHAIGNLLTNPREDQHVRIDRHAHRQNDTGDTRQGQCCTQQRHQRQQHDHVEGQRHGRDHTEEAVVVGFCSMKITAMLRPTFARVARLIRSPP